MTILFVFAAFIGGAIVGYLFQKPIAITPKIDENPLSVIVGRGMTFKEAAELLK